MKIFQLMIENLMLMGPVRKILQQMTQLKKDLVKKILWLRTKVMIADLLLRGFVKMILQQMTQVMMEDLLLTGFEKKNL